MPLLQKLLVSGFVPLIGQTLGALHKNSQNSLLLPFLIISPQTSLRTQFLIPLVACILLLQPHTPILPFRVYAPL